MEDGSHMLIKVESLAAQLRPGAVTPDECVGRSAGPALKRLPPSNIRLSIAISIAIYITLLHALLQACLPRLLPMPTSTGPFIWLRLRDANSS